LMSRPRDKWLNDRFDAVDWEHLDLALKNKSDMYDMAVKTAFRLLRHRWDDTRAREMPKLRTTRDRRPPYALP